MAVKLFLFTKKKCLKPEIVFSEPIQNIEKKEVNFTLL